MIVQVKTRESGVHLESPRRPSNNDILPIVLYRQWVASPGTCGYNYRAGQGHGDVDQLVKFIACIAGTKS